jgi:hypothetical protein
VNTFFGGGPIISRLFPQFLGILVKKADNGFRHHIYAKWKDPKVKRSVRRALAFEHASKNSAETVLCRAGPHDARKVTARYQGEMGRLNKAGDSDKPCLPSSRGGGIGRRKGLKILQEEKWAFSLKPNSASYLLKN